MRLTRRSFLTTVASVALAKSCPGAEPSGKRPLVGAIRWDAWYAPGSSVTAAVEKALSPPQYQWRAPFFAKVPPSLNAQVELPHASQSLIDLEIQQAAYARLDYWAFVGYGIDDPMSLALRYYLSSSIKDLVKFCFFTELARWGSADNLSSIPREHIELMKRPQYVRVHDERPLYFLGFIDKNILFQRWKGPDGLRSQLARFRAEAISAGVGNPYIVLAGPFAQASEWSSLGGDAVGAYALGDPLGIGSYSALEKVVEQRWRSLSSLGLPLVPTVMAGSDRRPRVEHPVPWESGQRPYVGMQYYFEKPTSSEISHHLQRALDFIAEQPYGLRAPAVLIYAWNENDEGGWLVPTLPCDTSHLEAVHRILAPGQISPPPSCSIP
ncbi:hypothetical protein [Bradyrhizobium sp. CCBAU 11357]|uniref:hypothetical protein n=1 Tax=Bradyrhizobium sp. CCBAU 11357 TaxID=1630808 RepID=UPI002304A82F|nr:hypothetical protein [Bradyrhizobium sp. CCBAU 11357]